MYDAKYKVSSRRCVQPSFNEVRHVLNLAQVLAMPKPKPKPNFSPNPNPNLAQVLAMRRTLTLTLTLTLTPTPTLTRCSPCDGRSCGS